MLVGFPQQLQMIATKKNMRVAVTCLFGQWINMIRRCNVLMVNLAKRKDPDNGTLSFCIINADNKSDLLVKGEWQQNKTVQEAKLILAQ